MRDFYVMMFNDFLPSDIKHFTIMSVVRCLLGLRAIVMNVVMSCKTLDLTFKSIYNTKKS